MIIAGNFKINHTRSSTLRFCQELDSCLVDSDVQVRLFPPSCTLPYNNFKHFKVGVQNAYGVQNGAYTGEIGLEQLQELQIQSLLIGHSERRTIFGESNALCAKKFAFFAKEGFEIFFCVGEDLLTRQSRGVEEFLFSQLKGIDLDYSRLVVAYEPIWAIGTGVSATLDEIENTHQILKSFGAKRVVYGGSVNASNAKEIMALPSVDGVLVGGASLKLESFWEIIKQGGEIQC